MPTMPTTYYLLRPFLSQQMLTHFFKKSVNENCNLNIQNEGFLNNVKKNYNIGREGFPKPSIRYMPSNQIIGQRMIIRFHQNKNVTP